DWRRAESLGNQRAVSFRGRPRFRECDLAVLRLAGNSDEGSSRASLGRERPGLATTDNVAAKSAPGFRDDDLFFVSSRVLDHDGHIFAVHDVSSRLWRISQWLGF